MYRAVLTDQNGNALVDKTVTLAYSVDNGNAHTQQSDQDRTNNDGQYNVQWLIQASGTFTVKAQWSGDQTLQGVSATKTLSFLPYQDTRVFFVESNSTVTGLTFDSSNNILGFNVTGPNGTQGTTKVTIAKTLTPNAQDFTVYLDGRQITYGIDSANDYWILTFSYGHSTHQVMVGTAVDAVKGAPSTATNNSTILIVGTVALIIGVSVVVLASRKLGDRPKH